MRSARNKAGMANGKRTKKPKQSKALPINTLEISDNTEITVYAKGSRRSSRLDSITVTFSDGPNTGDVRVLVLKSYAVAGRLVSAVERGMDDTIDIMRGV